MTTTDWMMALSLYAVILCLCNKPAGMHSADKCRGLLK